MGDCGLIKAACFAGIFCKQPISRDTKFGPFVGEIIAGDDIDKKRDEIDFRFAWHVSKLIARASVCVCVCVFERKRETD